MMFIGRGLLNIAATAIVLVAAANLILLRPSKGFWSTVPSMQHEIETTHDYNTTIIVTSSLIPSHPSIDLIETTMNSLDNIQGLPRNSPIIITIDGPPSATRGHPQTSKREILNQYTKALSERFADPNIVILRQPNKINLVGNVQLAMNLVKTEFVYLIQHDRPFISPIDHKALIQTMNQYPDEVRLVRFSNRETLARSRDKLGKCGDDIALEANGIGLSKTHTWSDSNHFTRKSYYEEMFSTIEGWESVRFMEKKMKVLGFENCSYWGSYLYGKPGHRPMIVHLDGRHATNVTTTIQGKLRGSFT